MPNLIPSRSHKRQPGVLIRLVHKVLGIIFLILGGILGPLPIPLGVPCALIGLALLAPYFKPIQNFIRWLRVKFPSLDRAFVKWRDKVPAFVREAVDVTTPHTAYNPHQNKSQP